ncbi:hypothetical protein CRENBAI_019699 [Crenichthys baileyi]|uniref:Small monomeric GTPase n=1 Tax=Crenichthys baileyi TaxID=28760 RepID=A0AAV9QSI5_9TELE
MDICLTAEARPRPAEQGKEVMEQGTLRTKRLNDPHSLQGENPKGSGEDTHGESANITPAPAATPQRHASKSPSIIRGQVDWQRLGLVLKSGSVLIRFSPVMLVHSPVFSLPPASAEEVTSDVGRQSISVAFGASSEGSNHGDGATPPSHSHCNAATAVNTQDAIRRQVCVWLTAGNNHRAADWCESVEQIKRLVTSVRSSGRRTSAPRMPEQSNDYRVVVFGAGGVGKSSLVLRFVKGTFRDTYIPTVEDTYRQVISCDKSVCTLQITDTTGSHQFPAMQRLSISKGHAFILVFSITSRQSLEELKPIYQQILAIKGSVESIPIMLVGNKSDETAQREVETKVGEAQATSWKCAFMETSAKTNTNVKELFQELLALEKKRDMSLSIDGKRSGKQKRADKLKGKCSVM